MRAVAFLLWVLAASALLAPVVRSLLTVPREPRHGSVPDELVKDPVCQTYVVRSRAIERRRAGQTVYFCSARCASRWG
jgi:hypothetical protein